MPHLQEIEFWNTCPAVRRLGGRVRFVDAESNALIDQLLQEVQESCFHQIACDPSGILLELFPLLIIENESCNAAAIEHRGEFAVLISSGLFQGLSKSIRHFVCTSQVLRQSFGIPVRHDVSLWSKGPEYFLSTVHQRESNYFLNCLGRALEFVFLHEAAHKIRDHRTLLGIAGESVFFDETLWLNESPDAASTCMRLNCEVDADVFALWLCQNGVVAAAQQAIPEADLHDYWLSELGIMVPSLTNLFMLLQSEVGANVISYASRYPPLLHRAIMTTANLRVYYAKLGKLEADFAKKIESQLWMDLANVADDLGISKGTWIAPEEEAIRVSLMNERLRGFREFQDRLDRLMDDRIR